MDVSWRRHSCCPSLRRSRGDWSRKRLDGHAKKIKNELGQRELLWFELLCSGGVNARG